MARSSGLGSNPLLNTDTAFDVEKERAELGIKQPEQGKKPKGRPKKDDLVRDNSVQDGLTKEWTRATFIVNVQRLNQLKNYAADNRISIKEALDEILGAVLKDENKNMPTEDEKEQAKQERLKKLGLR